MRKIICFSILVGLLSSCDSRPKGVGDHEKDQIKLGDATHLAHIHEALSGADEMTVADLFDPKKVVFEEAPNPSALLKYHHDANAERTASNETLSFLTYNIALLDAKLFGFIDYSASPHLEERRDELPTLILEKNH